MLLIFLFLVGLVIYINSSKNFDSAIKKRIAQDLEQIHKVLRAQNPLTYRDLTIRLDSLLSKSLQIYFSNNENCGTNLKKARNVFEKKHYNKIWDFHKLRNKVIHEDKEVTSSQVEEGYNIIKSAIKKLLYG